jgi:hypothetical protein
LRRFVLQASGRQLFDIIRTRRFSARFPRALNGREQQANQNANNSNDNQ